MHCPAATKKKKAAKVDSSATENSLHGMQWDDWAFQNNL